MGIFWYLNLPRPRHARPPGLVRCARAGRTRAGLGLIVLGLLISPRAVGA